MTTMAIAIHLDRGASGRLCVSLEGQSYSIFGGERFCIRGSAHGEQATTTRASNLCSQLHRLYAHPTQRQPRRSYLHFPMSTMLLRSPRNRVTVFGSPYRVFDSQEWWYFAANVAYIIDPPAAMSGPLMSVPRVLLRTGIPTVNWRVWRHHRRAPPREPYIRTRSRHGRQWLRHSPTAPRPGRHYRPSPRG